MVAEALALRAAGRWRWQPAEAAGAWIDLDAVRDSWLLGGYLAGFAGGLGGGSDLQASQLDSASLQAVRGV